MDRDHVPRREIRVSRINSSGERIVEVDTRDLSMPWLPGIGCVRLRVMLECDEIKSDISRVRMSVISFRR